MRLACGSAPASPRAVLLAAALIMVLVGVSAPARAAGQGANWQFAPAEAPPPPSGAQPSRFPAELGRVGDIAFWSPNRGVLITAGNALVPAGLYAYDGVNWHQLATVCGGTDGRIAWAAPDEFWTISDQRPGQITPAHEADSLADISLCHFTNGQVVGSYAMPIDQPDSYRPMDAAACEGADDCWFGGALGGGSNTGAFHLYWNGSVLSVVYSPQNHAVAAMAVDEGQIYESVQLAPGDSYGSESTTNPPVLHTIAASDPEDVFHNVFPTVSGCTTFCAPLPEYGTAGGEPVAPDTLAGFALSSDWSPSGEGPASPQQLWAVAGSDTTRPPAQESSAHPIVLLYSNEEWIQIVPNLATFEDGETPQGVAAEPGEQAAWITTASEDEVAHVDLLSGVEGTDKWTVSAHDDLGPEQGVGPRGDAGPIACPAPQECWLATSQGWLFHLTGGAQLAPDSDPFFDGEDGVITYRPPDAGVPEVISFQPPEDDSLANQQHAEAAATATPAAEALPAAQTKKAKALVSHVHTKLMAHDVLALTFTLTRSARVQLLASRHGVVVARTRRETLHKGDHTLELHLNPRRWPTKVNLRASAG